MATGPRAHFADFIHRSPKWPCAVVGPHPIASRPMSCGRRRRIDYSFGAPLIPGPHLRRHGPSHRSAVSTVEHIDPLRVARVTRLPLSDELIQEIGNTFAMRSFVRAIVIAVSRPRAPTR